MLTVSVNTRDLVYENLTLLANTKLKEPGDYHHLHTEVVLFTTFQWGAYQNDDGRNVVMLSVINTDDGELIGEQIFNDYFVGKWTVPGLPNVGIPNLEITVKVTYD